MQIGEVRNCVTHLESALGNIDVAAISGPIASDLLDALVPLSRRLSSLIVALGARGVACNQHSASASRSGAAWIASKTGVSEKQARAELGLVKELSSLPDVESSLMDGQISVEAAAVIARNAEANPHSTSELLDSARNGSVDQLHQHARELASFKRKANHQQRLRKSQFISAHIDRDSMITGHFRLLPTMGAALLNATKSTKAPSSWERAEQISQSLGLGAITRVSSKGPTARSQQRPSVVFHLELHSSRNENNPDSPVLDIGSKATLRGVGPIAVSEVMQHIQNASRTLVGNIDNKLVWFSEQDGRKADAELPEFIKSAVRANSWDQCEVSDCTRDADQVDHIVARCNGGQHSSSNLQALCEADHHAKTRQDAPWTVGGIYAKARIKHRQGPGSADQTLTVRPPEDGDDRPVDQLFPDTG